MEDAKFYEFLLAAFRNWLPHLAEGASAYIFHELSGGLNSNIEEDGVLIYGGKQ